MEHTDDRGRTVSEFIVFTNFKDIDFAISNKSCFFAKNNGTQHEEIPQKPHKDCVAPRIGGRHLVVDVPRLRLAFERYEEAPKPVADKVIAARAKAD